MSASVNVNMRGPKYTKVRRLVFQWTYPPSKPSDKNSTASIACSGALSLYGSRSHCHLKYSHQPDTCAVYGANLSSLSPYCSRLMLYISLSFVTLLSVQPTAISVTHPVVSP